MNSRHHSDPRRGPPRSRTPAAAGCRTTPGRFRDTRPRIGCAEDMPMCTREGRRCVAIGLDSAVQHIMGGDPACSGLAKQRSSRARPSPSRGNSWAIPSRLLRSAVSSDVSTVDRAGRALLSRLAAKGVRLLGSGVYTADLVREFNPAGGDSLKASNAGKATRRVR
jgi:hypothetical protein